MTFTFERIASAGAARAGVFTTPRGPVETPAFMAVGTLAIAALILSLPRYDRLARGD